MNVCPKISKHLDHGGRQKNSGGSGFFFVFWRAHFEINGASLTQGSIAATSHDTLTHTLRYNHTHTLTDLLAGEDRAQADEDDEITCTILLLCSEKCTFFSVTHI